MTRITLALYCVAASLLLAGCAKSDQTIGSDVEAKAGSPAFKYVDPREGYVERSDICSVPPCEEKKSKKATE
ncbi:hypothetical protein [Stenotrophomonas cyclobalanopsidis]|uniref:hypothetical protein n=1 Tax=Stenotrophomonas cyclobalanopsidis TaxID=2771362 RepID=UPI0028A80436|nr:hypothetical protein [Stenotrophomonas cyclobalanopsidis]